MRPQLYIVRGVDGKPQAIHQRTETEGGKRLAWWSLDIGGTPTSSLNGRPVTELALFGSQHVGKWDTSRPVFVVEGEADTLALANAGYRALGTVTGASTIPSGSALAVLVGFDVLLWPDNDRTGVEHMQAIAQQVRGVVRSLRWVEWSGAPAGGGAADYLTAGHRIEDLALVSVPHVEPSPVELIDFAQKHEQRRRRYQRPANRRGRSIEDFNAAVTVTDVLGRDFGLQAVAGRSVRCPFHDDRNPSLKILADDRRVYCHLGTCWANNNGRGRDAWDLAHAAVEVAR
ncbi:MAG: hypothetical protein M3O78_02705 [Chloroflexota bacterium]|nr:hypothetical protein [Chloroflexota bacterium]